MEMENMSGDRDNGDTVRKNARSKVGSIQYSILFDLLMSKYLWLKHQLYLQVLVLIQKKHNVEQQAEVEKMHHVFFHLSTRVRAILNAYGKRMSHSPGAPRRLQTLVFMLENKVNGVIAMSIAQCQLDQVRLWLHQSYIFIYW